MFNDEITDNFEDLLGKTIIDIEKDKENSFLRFKTSDNKIYEMSRLDEYGSVEIEDIVGDLNDLINTPILLAEVVYSQDNPQHSKTYKDINECNEILWTYYKLATIKGYVDIRWFGDNYYYSNICNFFEVDEEIGMFNPLKKDCSKEEVLAYLNKIFNEPKGYVILYNMCEKANPTYTPYRIYLRIKNGK